MSQGEPLETEVVELNQELLESIAQGDWETYSGLCDPGLSAFEPEARGHLVEGMDFHRFYFDLERSEGPVNTTMSRPHVRIIGDAAIVSYVRLVQRLDAAGQPVTACSEETRIWQRQADGWRHVHFHRSAIS
jgi:calcium/calmodulin-dependent protein kinase (CaM kinase) II